MATYCLGNALCVCVLSVSINTSFCLINVFVDWRTQLPTSSVSMLICLLYSLLIDVAGVISLRLLIEKSHSVYCRTDYLPLVIPPLVICSIVIQLGKQ